ncbi:MAG: FecCD family ABC transporter permease [Parvibaculales bacterium]
MRHNYLYLNGILGGLSLLAIVTACLVGSTSLTFSETMRALLGQGAPAHQLIIWELRLPRALAAFLVGAALGMAGAALQSLFRNPLAEPGIMGVSAGAVLSATFVLFYGLVGANSFIMPIMSVLGAILVTALLSFVAARQVSMVTLILVGVGLSSFAGALMALLMNLAPNPFTLSDMINWTLGSVAYRGFRDIIFILPFLILGGLILFSQRRGLAVLVLGDEAAQGLGVNMQNLRMMVVLGAGLLAGGSVALAGAIGFVGMIAPHIIRPYTHYNPAAALVPSALLAGLVLVIADICVRLLPTPQELKLGVIAALIGAPIFIYVALRGHYLNPSSRRAPQNRGVS